MTILKNAEYKGLRHFWKCSYNNLSHNPFHAPMKLLLLLSFNLIGVKRPYRKLIGSRDNSLFLLLLLLWRILNGLASQTAWRNSPLSSACLPASTGETPIHSPMSYLFYLKTLWFYLFFSRQASCWEACWCMDSQCWAKQTGWDQFTRWPRRRDTIIEEQKSTSNFFFLHFVRLAIQEPAWFFFSLGNYHL